MSGIKRFASDEYVEGRRRGRFTVGHGQWTEFNGIAAAAAARGCLQPAKKSGKDYELKVELRRQEEEPVKVEAEEEHGGFRGL